MKTTTTFILVALISITFFSVSIYAQSIPIIAGDTSSHVLFTDIPNVSLFAYPELDTLKYDIDCNNDSIDDFEISTFYADAGHAADIYFLQITPYNLNKIAISRIEYSYERPVAKIIIPGDTIESGDWFVNEKTILNEFKWTISGGTTLDIEDWDGVTDKYIGCQLVMSDSIINPNLNCWIKVSVPQATKIIIKEYACSVNTLGVSNSQNLQNPYIIYPNPTSDFFTVNGDNIIKVELWKDMRFIKKKICNKENQIKIDLQGLKSGLFFIKIITEKEIFVRKLIKK